MLRGGTDMTFLDEENDALGEITNIFAGAAACSLSNITDVDVDISVPSFREAQSGDKVVDTMSNCFGYRFKSPSFSDGFCFVSFQGEYNRFARLFGVRKNEEYVSHMMKKIISTGLEPVERLMEKTINIEVLKKVSDNFDVSFMAKNSGYFIVEFNMIIDDDIEGKIVVVYPERTAKTMASRFLSEGIAVTTV